MSEDFFCSKWLIRRRQNSRWLTSSIWVRMNEFQSDWISLSQSFVQNGWIQDRRIHDGSIIKLSQNEWVKFFCPNGGNQSWQVWVSLSRYIKMAESKMAKFNMVEFIMVAIIKLSENEWVWIRIELVWVRVRLEWECFWVILREDNKVSQSKMAVAESNMAEFKIAVIIKLSQNEWVKLSLCK